jgi:hypothetical protein
VIASAEAQWIRRCQAGLPQWRGGNGTSLSEQAERIKIHHKTVGTHAGFRQTIQGRLQESSEIFTNHELHPDLVTEAALILLMAARFEPTMRIAKMSIRGMLANSEALNLTAI